MYPFFKNTRKDFFDIIQPLHPKQYTVVVIYLDGYRKEYPCIESPFQYMNAIKKNPKVKTCFIK
jgi:hypothetical protein